MKHALLDPVSRLTERVRALEHDIAVNHPPGLLADAQKVLTAATHLEALAITIASDPACDEHSVLGSIHRHDLLNSLNQIIGFGEILGEEAADNNLAPLLGELQSLLAEARALTAHIDALAGRGGTDQPPPPAPSSIPIDAPPPRNLSRQRPLRSANPVLVVDDDALNREMLSALLRRYGLEVVEAEDGLIALEILDRQPIDLVLLDVMMPKLDGYGVLQRMNANPGLQDVPVLVISGLSEIESVVRCIESGATDYLTKPFNQVLLRARIGACLEKKALRDQERQTLRALKESQQRLAAELAEAADYVRSLLPAPLGGAIDIDWRFLPSTHLGGDAVGYHWVDPRHLALYVIDVCGHGVGAALLAVSVMHVLRTQALHGTDFLDPAAVLEKLNTAFPMDQHNGQYFTMWYGVYDSSARRIRFAGGGHPPAILISYDGGIQGPIVRLGRPGLIIGAMADVTFEAAEADLPPGSRLFVFSDGAYEITRPDGSMLSLDEFEGMVTTLAGHHPRPLAALVAALRTLRGAEQFEDDVSVMEILFN
jgi:sigma-B regulation protein RsbU (phosphoserine phosphatase)